MLFFNHDSDCSRRFLVFLYSFAFISFFSGALLNAFVWPDLIMSEGVQHQSGNGYVGEVSKNGCRSFALWGFSGIFAPAMLMAVTDKQHQRCYIITALLHNIKTNSLSDPLATKIAVNHCVPQLVMPVLPVEDPFPFVRKKP